MSKKIQIRVGGGIDSAFDTDTDGMPAGKEP